MNIIPKNSKFLAPANIATWFIRYAVPINILLSGATPKLNQAAPWQINQNNHQLSYLSDDQISYLSKFADPLSLKKLVAPIAVPRVSGTEGNYKVREFLKLTLKSYGWKVDEDEFLGKPPHPHAERKFSNIIATLNPSAPRQLVFACHHDSKWFKEGKFIGATDSAVPCAMLLQLAEVLKPFLDGCHKNDDLSLQFIFFDGEEAFAEWTATDSLYGSRHLADMWAKEKHPKHEDPIVNKLHGMDLFVLLDLIGHQDVRFFSFYRNTHKYFQRLSEIEHELSNAGNLKGRGKVYFMDRRPLGYNPVDDDHRPFAERGVKIIHLVPPELPPFWHTLQDDLQVIDYDASNDIVKILSVFICEYLGCDVNQVNEVATEGEL